MYKKVFLFLFLSFILLSGEAQELQARFTVIASKVSTQVDRKVFQTLQTAVTNFLNSRRWTSDVFQPNEKLQ